jgi:hypothetical protein
MLSETNSIIDVKRKLGNDFAYFEYASDSLFINDLEDALEEVYLGYFLPRIGALEYDLIQDKDKTNLTAIEAYLYWAEVYATCFEFLKKVMAVDNQAQNSGSEHLSVEGYTHSISSGGSSPGNKSIRYYWDKAYKYFKHAGIDIAAMQRTCTIFGDTEPLEDIIEIVPLT